jgi:hypothetical protein
MASARIYTESYEGAGPCPASIGFPYFLAYLSKNSFAGAYFATDMPLPSSKFTFNRPPILPSKVFHAPGPAMGEINPQSSEGIFKG